MKPPKALAPKTIGHINIHGQKWDIVKVFDMSEDCVGLCHSDKPLIEITHVVSGSLRKITIMHEILHAAFFRLGYRNAGIPSQVEELIVDQLATFLVENWTEISKVLNKK